MVGLLVKKHVRYSLSSFFVLAGVAVLLFASDRFAYWIAGYRPLAQLDAGTLDEPPPINDRDAPRFFAQRNEVELVVPRDMTLGELLRLYQLVAQPHVRAEIARLQGAATLADDHPLRRGQRFRITLNPPAPPPEGAP